ncbi:MAG: SDR family oxidoreductase [Actinomycetota bacterium]|nr:SDR family oxidoreductase [Actinomycetota bacterium]MDA2970774.1 SDR family oxidoreductase [Actinomycetota bacterium]MDA3001155.1 SDR family oxidoreductase [Actinomycetota bacterium]
MSVRSLFDMSGRVALLSGAGRGIGAASALALAEAGADIAVLARSADQIEAVAAEARAMGRRAIAIPTDANDADAVHAAVERTATELGRIDVVVGVVGGSMPQPFMNTSDKDLRNAFENNVVNGLRLVRACVPHLVSASEGRVGASSVVMVSSAIGHVVGRGYVAYGSAKAALDHAVHLMAADLNPKIRVNAVAPGAILTEALEVVAADPALKKTIEDATPLRRLGEPDDIAAAVLYLASHASSYVTGQVLPVDGGVLTTNFNFPIPDL